MNKLLTLTMQAQVWIIVLLFTSSASATKPDRMSVQGLYNKFIETQDISYLSTIFYRCNALQSVIAASIENDFGDSESAMVKGYEEAAAKSLNTAMLFERKQREKRGAKLRSDEVRISLAIKTIEPMAKEYVLWMNNNQLKTGDRIDGSLGQELTICTQIVESL